MLYIKYKQISKRDFYAKSGISRGTLESNTGITEEIMAKVIANHPELSLKWLIKGEGSMIEEIQEHEKKQNEKDNRIELEMIRDLSAENALLKKEIEELKSKK